MLFAQQILWTSQCFVPSLQDLRIKLLYLGADVDATSDTHQHTNRVDAIADRYITHRPRSIYMTSASNHTRDKLPS